MVLGEGYDKSLWLVSYSDKKSREYIADFMNSIPDGLYEKIKMSVDTINKYINGDISCRELDYNKLHDSEITLDKVMYWYYIDPYSCGITLGYAIENENSYDDTFEITVFPFDKIKNGEYNLMLRIKDVNDINSFKDSGMNYFVLRYNKDYIVKYSGRIIQSRIIHAEEIPQNVEIDDLRRRKKWLVRNRVIVRK